MRCRASHEYIHTHHHRRPYTKQQHMPQQRRAPAYVISHTVLSISRIHTHTTLQEALHQATAHAKQRKAAPANSSALDKVSVTGSSAATARPIDAYVHKPAHSPSPQKSPHVLRLAHSPSPQKSPHVLRLSPGGSDAGIRTNPDARNEYYGQLGRSGNVSPSGTRASVQVRLLCICACA